MYLLELWCAEEIVNYRWSFNREDLVGWLERFNGRWASDEDYRFYCHDKFEWGQLIDISNKHPSDEEI